jgi:hypothetical protein
MLTLGEQLRHARESQALGIDQVCEMTRMRRDEIHALEEGNYGTFQTLGFVAESVKTYAIVLRLDFNRIMGQLGRELPDSVQIDAFARRSFANAVVNDDLAYVKALIERNPVLVFIKMDGGAMYNNGKYNNSIDDFPPLHLAVEYGYHDMVKFLLDKGAEINDQENFSKFTPLHFAAVGGHKAIAELLLTKGADVNAKDKSDRTPLHFAADGGHKAVAELLLTKWPDVNAKAKDGGTPLSFAVDMGRKEVANLLRRHGGKGYTSGLLRSVLRSLIGPVKDFFYERSQRRKLQNRSNAGCPTQPATPHNSLRRRINEIVTLDYGSRSALDSLIVECKHDPNGISILREARSNCSRHELLYDLDSAIKSLVAASTSHEASHIIIANAFSDDFKSAINKHIKRIEENPNDKLRRFTNEYLSPEVVGSIAAGAGEKMRLSHSDGLEHSFSVGTTKVLYVVSTLPFDCVQAKEYFVNKYGGYAECLAKLLNVSLELVQSQVLCHITYCRSASCAWVNVSIFHVRGDEFSNLPKLIAVDLLSNQEKQKLQL